MVRLLRKMLINVMSVFLLSMILAGKGNAAGIELAVQDRQTEEETQSQTAESETAQVVASGQNRINSTINVGARTLDSTRTRVLVIGLFVSAGILSGGLLYRYSRRRSC